MLGIKTNFILLCIRLDNIKNMFSCLSITRELSMKTNDVNESSIGYASKVSQYRITVRNKKVYVYISMNE